MTLTDVLKDFAYLSVLLLIGFELRKRITLFQRYFIPTSLIAGTIGMFFSPSWLGEVSPVYIPFSSGIGQWSGVLVIVVCATMFLSLELNQVGRDGMATTFLAGAAHQGQMASRRCSGCWAARFLISSVTWAFGVSMRATAMPPPWVTSSRMPACGTMQWAWA